MSSLYAVDAVHEFPFTYPGVPSRLEGRDEIVNWMASGWKTNVPQYGCYRPLAVHDTSDPETIVVEQDALGTSASTGEFALPNIVVLTVRNGEIVRLRDYVDILRGGSRHGPRHLDLFGLKRQRAGRSARRSGSSARIDREDVARPDCSSVRRPE